MSARMVHDIAATRTRAWPAGWTVCVDALDAAGWNAVLDTLDDSNVYQTWAHEAVQAGPRRMSHLVVRDERGAIRAAAQVRLTPLAWLRVGIAYVRWGPMWRRAGGPCDWTALRVALDALVREYAVRRGLALRLLPGLQDAHHGDDACAAAEVRQAYIDAGFSPLAGHVAQRTLLMDIDAPLAQLRAGLDQKWRNGLNRAERQGLIVHEGTSDDLFARFVQLHAQMCTRKCLVAMSDVGAFARMQQLLAEPHRMRVLLAEADGELAAGVVCSHLGQTGLYLHGATSDAGLRTQASYLLQWRAIGWLQQQGATRYNLHGIDPVTNPGTYHFKAGLCGRNGRELQYPGAWQCSPAPISRWLVQAAEPWRVRWRRGRRAARGWLDSHAPREAAAPMRPKEMR